MKKKHLKVGTRTACGISVIGNSAAAIADFSSAFASKVTCARCKKTNEYRMVDFSPMAIQGRPGFKK